MTDYFIQDLVNEITTKDRKLIQNLKDKLIEENGRLGNPWQGFLFHGKFVTNLVPKLQATAPKKLLDKTLHDQGHELFTQTNLLNKETRRMIQALQVITKQAHTAQDVRDMLPDVCVPYLPSQYSTLKRTRPEGFLYSEKPIKRHEYEYTVDLLTFYVANAYLY